MKETKSGRSKSPTPIKVGRLVYKYGTKRPGNIGEEVFASHLSVPVVDVLPCDAMSCDVLLVSIPSTYQYIDYIKAAKKYNFSKRTKTVIVIGGYGAINPFFLTEHYDYFVLGRTHSSADRIVRMAHSRELGALDYVVDATRHPLRKVISQDALCEVESFVGCPYRCKFCQYAHIRSRQGRRTGYIQETLTAGKSPELMFNDIVELKEKPGRIRTAIDGFSERLRLSYGKKITNQNISDAIRYLGSLSEGRTPVVVTLYNIANMPSETSDDYLEFVDLINEVDEPKGRVIIAIYSTTFRPSPLTPMERMRAGTFPSIVPMRLKEVRSTRNLLVKHAYSLEGPYSALQCTLIERCPIDGYEVFQQAVLAPKVGQSKSNEKAIAVLDKYNLWGHIDEMDTLPTDFIRKPRAFVDPMSLEEAFLKFTKRSKTAECFLIG